jgi:heme/copper-type cytochrome/quinol oxidase subunit 2
VGDGASLVTFNINAAQDNVWLSFTCFIVMVIVIMVIVIMVIVSFYIVMFKYHNAERHYSEPHDAKCQN